MGAARSDALGEHASAPTPPEESAGLRAAIISTARAMNALGINQGKSGNVSARIDATHFLITPSGTPYDRLAPDDLPAMSLSAADERDFAGPRLPSSEWRFHRDIYRARRDVQAIVHTHGVYATTLACLDRGIPAFHYMVAIGGGNDIRCAPYATFGTQQLSDFAVAAEVETLARMYWQALQIGEPAVLPDDEMRRVIEKFRAYGQPRGA
jgi:L-fuculose-phosphate aldolase